MVPPACPCKILDGLTGGGLFLPDPDRKDWKRCPMCLMCGHWCKAIGITTNQGNSIPPKEQSKALVTDAKEMDVHQLPNKEFKISILKKLSEL